MWLGESAHSLDEKNRVFLPRRFQGGLDRDTEGRTTAVLTRGFEGCLFVFSEGGFQRLLERMSLEVFDGPTQRTMQRLFFSNAHHVVLDSAGRLLLPEKLKALVGIDKDVVLVGVLDRIEVWPKATWEAFERDHGAEFDQLDQVLGRGRQGSAAAAGVAAAPQP